MDAYSNQINKLIEELYAWQESARSSRICGYRYILFAL